MYDSLSEVYFESFEQFVKDVDQTRDKILRVDSEEIRQEPVSIDIKTVEKLPDGRWNTNYKNIEFECFFHRKDSDILYVFLGGAITAKNASLPQFARWSWYKFIQGSMLCIADPMYRKYSELKLGWYYGDEEINFQEILADLVFNIAEKLCVEQKNIVFVGSSGGGYASIACSSHIVGAKSIAINPQMVLNEWPYSEVFSKITGIDLHREDVYHRNNLLYYLNNKANRYTLFINLRSWWDMQQVKNICNAMNISVHVGLNVFENLIIWLYDADLAPWIDYHDTQGNYCMWHVLEQLAVCEDNPGKYSSLVGLMNEFYYEENKLVKYWRGRIPDIKKLRDVEHMNRAVAIWGTGGYTERLNEDLFCIDGENYYHIKLVIDNDRRKKDGLYHGIKIKHPSDIVDWGALFIIITSEKYEMQIRGQLEEMGLMYRQDFIGYKDLFKTG